MPKPLFSHNEVLAGWQAAGAQTVRHPHGAPDAPALEPWGAVRVQHAVGWLATVQARAEAGLRVTPNLALRLRAAGFTLAHDTLNRWQARHEGGLITAWADDLPQLHGCLLATVQRSIQTPSEVINDTPAT